MKDEFLDRVYQLENPFFLAFYEQSIESIVADAYEYFVELSCENNFFYENLKRMNKERGRRFFKMMAIYHTIQAQRKKREKIKENEIRDALIFVFHLDEREQKLYDLLFTCACYYKSQFQALFDKALAKYLFGKEVDNPFTLAFLENFCYNSYSSFLSSFTKYISLNRRIQKAN